MNPNRTGRTLVLAAVALVASALPGETANAQALGQDQAHAVLVDAQGATVGSVTAVTEGSVTRVRAEVVGLSTGFHGFHVHANGDCTVGDASNPFTAAGGHYNTNGAVHADHAGDMPVLFVGGDGAARATFTTDHFTVASLFDANGSAFVVHAAPDNYANIPARYTSSTSGATGPDTTTLGTGDSGGRVACGVAQTGRAVMSSGYWLTTSDGGVYAFGDAPFHGSMAGQRLGGDVIAMAAEPGHQGYWLASDDGGVYGFGAAEFRGSAAGLDLAAPIVDLATPPSHALATIRNQAGDNIGWARLSQEGRKARVEALVHGLAPGWHGFHVHSVGACTGDFTSASGHFNPFPADHQGHAGDLPLLYADGNGTAWTSFVTDHFSVPQLFDENGSSFIVHAAADNYANIPARYSSASPGAPANGPDAATLATGDSGGRVGCGEIRWTGGSSQNSYWLAADDGGVFTFGDAAFFGSAAPIVDKAPIVSIAPTPTGEGYWLAGADGGVYAFGDAAFFGSASGFSPAPIFAMAATPTGKGYWLVGIDGGVFAFGDAAFKGSAAGLDLADAIVGIAPTSTGQGYWLIGADGGVFAFGDADFRGSAAALPINGVVLDGVPLAR